MTKKWKIKIEDVDEEFVDQGYIQSKATIEFEAVTLNEVMQGVLQSIQAAGYNYVDDVTATKAGGGQVSAYDFDNVADITDLLDSIKVDKKENKANLKVVKNKNEDEDRT